MNQFEQAWQEWADTCVDARLLAPDRATLRIVFYSGAMTWERMALHIRTSNRQEDALAMLAELYEEMRVFAETMIRELKQ
ncbi:MAG TPA: hypothetical protein VJO99_07060 [Burkholderiaceae bacterium]|nr:hypothetical protein [Burkholderiaceae bacterium]